MSIEQLRLILYDTYQMDLWYPPLFGKWINEFKKTSYSQWAIDELVDYIARRIFPDTDGSIDKFCELTHDYLVMTNWFSRINSRTHRIFKIANSTASDILDLLHAMR